MVIVKVGRERAGKEERRQSCEGEDVDVFRPIYQEEMMIPWVVTG